MKTYDRLKARADRAGISIVKLCDKIGVHRNTLERWRLQEPKTLTILEKIETELSNIEEQNLLNLMSKKQIL